MSNLTNNLGPRGSMCEKKKQSPQPSTPPPPPANVAYTITLIGTLLGVCLSISFDTFITLKKCCRGKVD